MKQSHQKIYVAVYFLTTTDSAFPKLLALENSQLCNVYFNSWVFLCISLVELCKTEDLFDARCERYRASFPLFQCCFFLSRLVWVTRVWGKPFVFIQATTIWSFLWISLTKCVDRNTWTPSTPRHIYIKKQNKKVTPSWLHPSASHWFLLLPSPSLSVACYCCITKIFLRREMSKNVHNVLHIETLEVR